MAIVKPFCCVRPAVSVADQVAALPYDVYNRKEACQAVAGHPLSFLNIDRPETQFDESVDIYADCVYDRARQLLDARMADGTFVKDADSCYYIYELTMNGRVQTGIAACSSVDDYLNQIIRKHENTRADKELDRIRHVDACDAQTGPIFLAYRSRKGINDLIAEAKMKAPLYDFTSEDGVRHAVWRISDSNTVRDLEREFEQVPNTYIADGHHRAASAVKVAVMRREQHPGYDGSEPFNYFLSVLFPDDQLMIMPYNRVVKDLNGLTEEEFLAAVGEKFTVEKLGAVPYQPANKAEFGLYLSNNWYRLTAGDGILSRDPVEGLDVSILQNHLLGPILGIEDPRVDKRIDFIGGIRGLGELERRVGEDMKAAFSMYPTSIAELFSVADAGLLMPPKSTWFEPKLRSGLFIHTL
ncbi:DUF1015 domain-containing protein [Lachnotalea sp. AF33-28]|jgi:uncharacterized protein (DUF1015 family)|uniref:DUF1015 domain-containing protein n=1 Tax=Lachnotalea sp. AF33-28 TaxID=2292046 RepID=UPI000E4919BF|nr:DUF1015 family protein [Lachnotalea sp. AF33-28]RHP35041.1 DUF1015 domain-containing protein [Lachnotalea sp. AF33-28]